MKRKPMLVPLYVELMSKRELVDAERALWSAGFAFYEGKPIPRKTLEEFEAEVDAKKRTA